MNQKTFNTVASVMFSLVALGHLLRLLSRSEAVVAGWHAPMWASVLALVVSGYLALSAFKLRK